MKENKLIIAAAGSGKTTRLVVDAFNRNGNVLITTFTDENEAEIHEKFISKYGFVPEHVTIQTWFSFLLQHGIRPYQGTCYSELFDKRIKSIYFVESIGGVKYYRKVFGKKIPVLYKEEEEFMQHYFTDDMSIYTDKLAKFVIRANKKSKGEVINRISRIYPTIFIDEVQDLAGYDLEIVKELFHNNSTVVCVGDPRQVTYYTHLEKKHSAYKNGMFKDYVLNVCHKSDQIVIDEISLSSSHRNNKPICDFSSRIYPAFPVSVPCNCESCHPLNVEHQGVFIVKESDLDHYLEKYNPVQLRHNVKIKTQSNYSSCNFGKSKGKTYQRVLIYPTKDIKEWLKDNSKDLKDKTRAGFYVAVTRARFSVAFVIPDAECSNFQGIEVWEN